MPGPKPKIVREKVTLKKRIINGAAVGLLSSALSIGVADKVNNPMRSADQRSRTKAAITQIDKQKVDVGSRAVEYYSKNPNLIRETVNSYNQKAKLGQIFFYDGKKIKSVYFDQTRLSQINSIIPRNEKAEINNLILERVKLIEENAIYNPTLGKKIIDRVGELDYAKYLLSLTPRELKNAFPEAETAVRKALENSNPEILKKVKAENRAGAKVQIISSFIAGLLIGAITVRGKKIN